MNTKHKVCTLVFLLFSIINAANAAQNSQTSSPPITAKAFVLDTKIWPTTTIQICWENYETIKANSEWERRRKIRFRY